MAQRATYPAPVARLLSRADDPNQANATALHVWRDDDFRPVSWQTIGDDVRRVAANLLAAGLQPGDRIAVISPNRYEWIVADLAIQLARGVHTPIHATLAAPQIAYQVRDCEPSWVIIAGDEHAAKLAAHEHELPKEPRYASFDPVSGTIHGRPYERFEQLLAPPSADVTRLVEESFAKLSSDDLATILYTSGSTGEPKGVMLANSNLVFNAQATVAATGSDPQNLRLCWLPLSHIFARTCDLYTWIECGYELGLARSRETVVEDCKRLRPTLLNGVPYFFEKVYRTLRDAGRHEEPGALNAALGGRLSFCCSGGAPLPDHVAECYLAHGIALAQGYGLTETSPVITTGSRTRNKVGTVGPVVEGVEVRIAEDGEVLTRGPHVMRGYWKLPEATAEVLRDGWFHTGDLGELDDEGFLRITGRKKELIVTSGGKNIAPVAIEAMLVEDPFIQQAMVVGDGRDYLVALIHPTISLLAAELKHSGDAEAVCKDPQARRLIEERVQARLAGVSVYEQVRKCVLLPNAFTVEREQLTPTLKLRRSVIAAQYSVEIEAIYAERGRPTAYESNCDASSSPEENVSAVKG